MGTIQGWGFNEAASSVCRCLAMVLTVKFLLSLKGAAKASLLIQSVALVKVQGTKPTEGLELQAK